MVQLKTKTLSVKFYMGISGREPVKEWLKSLAKADCKIIGEDIKTVELGWPLGMPLVRKLDRGLWEVRSRLLGGQIARVLFTVSGSTMVLLHGFIKKTQKTPKYDLGLVTKRLHGVKNYKR